MQRDMIWCNISAHKKTTHEEHRHGHDLEHKHALDFAQQLLLPNDEINAISRLPKHAAGWAGHVSPTGLHNKVWPGQVMPSPFGKLSMTRTVIQTRPQRSQNGRCLCSCVHVYVYLSVCLSVHLKCVSLDLASKVCYCIEWLLHVCNHLFDLTSWTSLSSLLLFSLFLLLLSSLSLLLLLWRLCLLHAIFFQWIAFIYCA